MILKTLLAVTTAASRKKNIQFISSLVALWFAKKSWKKRVYMVVSFTQFICFSSLSLSAPPFPPLFPSLSKTMTQKRYRCRRIPTRFNTFWRRCTLAWVEHSFQGLSTGTQARVEGEREKGKREGRNESGEEASTKGQIRMETGRHSTTWRVR